MFKHLYTYRLKVLLKNKSIIFWSLLFPLVLSLFFNMAFSNLDKEFTFETISVGVVETVSTEENKYFSKSLKDAKNKDKRIFNTTTYTEKQGEKALEENKISGYFLLSKDKPTLVINQNGFNQTFLQDFLQRYLQVAHTIDHLSKNNPQLLTDSLVDEILTEKSYVKKINYSHNPPTSTALYFFTVIAMACMLGMNWGIKNSDDLQANQSAKGIRMGMNPFSKIKIVLTNLLAAFTIFFAEILFLLAFIHFVLKIDFGQRWGAILFTCFIGCLLSISLGSLVGAIFKKNHTIKLTITLTISVFGGFLSGMMLPDVKYWMDQHLPLVNLLNPTNLISDSLYKLFYYTNLDGFYFNMLLISFYLVIINCLNYYFIRREKYVSL